MTAVNESTKHTHFSNVTIGTATGGGALIVAGTTQNMGATTSVTAGQTLVAADNGKTLFLGDAASGDITLPAVTTTGFYVKVICGFTITTASAVLSAEGDNISGVFTVNGALIPAVAEDQINFIGSAAVAGDWAEFTSDGSAWLCTGIGSAAGSITATDPA